MLDRINDIFIKDQTVNILPKVAVLGGTAIGSGCVIKAGGAVMKTRNKKSVHFGMPAKNQGESIQ
jgi:serine acetyltransferase